MLAPRFTEKTDSEEHYLYGHDLYGHDLRPALSPQRGHAAPGEALVVKLQRELDLPRVVRGIPRGTNFSEVGG